MRPFKILILTLVVVACSPELQHKLLDNKTVITNTPVVTDSCLHQLYVDRNSVETVTFKNFWTSAERVGYTFNDDTVVPFVKVIFQPKTSKFYNDTLKIFDCSIFDSVNIHKADILSRKPIDRNYYPNLNIEEWNFKDSSAATDYVHALTDYYKNGYGLKSPTIVLQTNRTVYIFKTAAYRFASEMERMTKLIRPQAKVYVTNY